MLKVLFMDRRVVITGMGVVSPIGNDVPTFWNNLLNGFCGIDTIDSFVSDGLPVHIGGLVKDFNPAVYGIEKSFSRKQDPYAVYALAAAVQAMAQSGLSAGETDGNIDPFRLGVNVSSGIGGIEITIREAVGMVNDPAGQWVSPNYIPTMIPNIAAGHIAIKFQAKGPCMDVSAACASSTFAIGEAYRTIRHGYADAMISGGADHCTIPLGIAGFANARALTRETDPKHASLPFNLNRGGFVMSDGAAVLVLEEYEHAKARGAEILCEIVGYGATCDAFHATAPRPDGTTQARCISLALEEAGFDASTDTVYVNAHGTGTKLNDTSETLALKLAFGESAYKLHVSSTKSMHGHMLGASGAAEAIATILALKEGTIPPTINLDTPDPECDLDYTPNVPVHADLTLGVSDSFGFGGHNACIAFRKIR